MRCPAPPPVDGVNNRTVRLSARTKRAEPRGIPQAVRRDMQISLNNALWVDLHQSIRKFVTLEFSAAQYERLAAKLPTRD